MGLGNDFKKLARDLFKTFADFRDTVTFVRQTSKATGWKTKPSVNQSITDIRAFRTEYKTPEEREIAGGADTKMICLAEDFDGEIPTPSDRISIPGHIGYSITHVKEQTHSLGIVYVLGCKERI